MAKGFVVRLPVTFTANPFRWPVIATDSRRNVHSLKSMRCDDFSMPAIVREEPGITPTRLSIETRRRQSCAAPCIRCAAWWSGRRWRRLRLRLGAGARFRRSLCRQAGRCVVAAAPTRGLFDVGLLGDLVGRMQTPAGHQRALAPAQIVLDSRMGRSRTVRRKARLAEEFYPEAGSGGNGRAQTDTVGHVQSAQLTLRDKLDRKPVRYARPSPTFAAISAARRLVQRHCAGNSVNSPSRRNPGAPRISLPSITCIRFPSEAGTRPSIGKPTMNRSCTNHTEPRFQLGHIVVTPEALAALEAGNVPGVLLLAQHIHGDWGDLTEEDQLQNELALLLLGLRVLSHYALPGGGKVWMVDAPSNDRGQCRAQPSLPRDCEDSASRQRTIARTAESLQADRRRSWRQCLLHHVAKASRQARILPLPR
jgi:hypothetical protein